MYILVDMLVEAPYKMLDLENLASFAVCHRLTLYIIVLTKCLLSELYLAS